MFKRLYTGHWTFQQTETRRLPVMSRMVFLDQVIITKGIDDQIWRFTCIQKLYHLEAYHRGVRTDHPLAGDIAHTLADHFQMDGITLDLALNISGIGH